MIKKFITVSAVFVAVILLVTLGRLWLVYGGDVLKLKHQMEPLTDPVDMSSMRFMGTDGTSHIFSEFHGKTVLVMFWATWCKYCMRDMPSVAEFVKRQHNETLLVLPVAIPSDTKVGVKRFMQRYGNGIEAYVNQTPEIYRKLQMRGVPYYVVVDPSGSAIASIKPRWEPDLARLLAAVR